MLAKVENSLKDLSIRALELITSDAPQIHAMLYTALLFTRMRRIVGPIQFEEMWKKYRDGEEGIANKEPYTHILFKFSPSGLIAAEALEFSLNEFSWAFILPESTALNGSEKPQSALDYLSLGSIEILSMNQGAYSVSKLSEFIDLIAEKTS